MISLETVVFHTIKGLRLRLVVALTQSLLLLLIMPSLCRALTASVLRVFGRKERKTSTASVLMRYLENNKRCQVLHATQR
jgi:hypothetical protein